VPPNESRERETFYTLEETMVSDFFLDDGTNKPNSQIRRCVGTTEIQNGNDPKDGISDSALLPRCHADEVTVHTHLWSNQF
jgi:hypothetical protein